MISAFGPRIIVPRAPIADIIDPNVTNCALADVYSMFRLVRGYTGACRIVSRASDLTTAEFGFTAGGLYDIKSELAWAAGSSTTVLGWYNQSPSRLTGRPDMIDSAPETAALIEPASTTSGAPVLFGGFPAIGMVNGSGLAQDTRSPALSYENYVSTVWIGSALFAGGASVSDLWNIHADSDLLARERYSFSVNSSSTNTATTRGIYVGRVGTLTHPASNFTDRTLIAMTHQVASPYGETAWVNGSTRTITNTGSVTGINVGGAMIRDNSIVHTYIVDGSSGRAIRDLAVTSFNRNNWIHP